MLTYTVRPGDTLGVLATRLLGPGGKPSDFQQWNDIPDLNVIDVGEVIQYPDPNAPSTTEATTSTALAPVVSAAPQAAPSRISTLLSNSTFIWSGAIGIVAIAWYLTSQKRTRAALAPVTLSREASPRRLTARRPARAKKRRTKARRR